MLDDVDLCAYGTSLDPIEEDEVTAKKPVPIQDQVVTDENGRRRFHGAFTGGFSAGYWNTVGSQEGWTPQTFKSSRNEKALKRMQMPEDFMDDEDLGQFGIAPQGIRTHDDYTKTNGNGEIKKRKLMQPSFEVIPGGTPVLEELFSPIKDGIAVRILKSWGWRPGQGVGPRLTKKQKIKTNERRQKEMYLMERYGCQKEDGLQAKARAEDDDDEEEDDSDGDDEEDNEITFAPDDYDPYVAVSKSDTFGLGYSGLSRDPVLSDKKNDPTLCGHINLFGPLEILGKNNQKLSISGQAFGVGALEDEDDDIYARDDVTKYDFSLDMPRKSRKLSEKPMQDATVIEGFVEPQVKVQTPRRYTVPMTDDYRPRNWTQRRSRFEPLDPERSQELKKQIEMKIHGLGRHDMRPEERGEVLGEPQRRQTLQEKQDSRKTREQRSKDLLELITSKSNNFTRGGIVTAEGEEKPLSVLTEEKAEHGKQLAKATDKTRDLGSFDPLEPQFKPFIADEAKQTRYEKFLEANLQVEKEMLSFLSDIQPLHFSDWDRQMEMKEFLQARQIFKPLKGLMSGRFVSEAFIGNTKVVTAASSSETPDEQRKITAVRTKSMWKPHSLLCKRYNIPEPFGGALPDEVNPRKRSSKAKFSVFDYLEESVNKKSDFHTPVVIPRNVERSTEAVEKSPIKVPVQPPAKEEIHSQARVATTNHLVEETSKASSSRFSKPKTELERRCEEAKDMPIAEKTELFRAIFEDSGDEGGEREEKTTAVNPQNHLESAAVFIENCSASAAAFNFLRNDSPPRGIFAALFDDQQQQMPPPPPPPLAASLKNGVSSTDFLTSASALAMPLPLKISFTPKHARGGPKSPLTPPAENLVYGPAVPGAKISRASTTETEAESPISANLHRKLLRLVGKSGKERFVVEEWVEKKIDTNRNASGSSDDDDRTSSSESGSSPDRKRPKVKKFKKHKSRDRAKKKSKKKKDPKKKKSKKTNKSHKSQKHIEH